MGQTYETLPSDRTISIDQIIYFCACFFLIIVSFYRLEVAVDSGKLIFNLVISQYTQMHQINSALFNNFSYAILGLPLKCTSPQKL